MKPPAPVTHTLTLSPAAFFLGDMLLLLLVLPLLLVVLLFDCV